MEINLNNATPEYRATIFESEMRKLNFISNSLYNVSPEVCYIREATNWMIAPKRVHIGNNITFELDITNLDREVVQLLMDIVLIKNCKEFKFSDISIESITDGGNYIKTMVIVDYSP